MEKRDLHHQKRRDSQTQIFETYSVPRALLTMIMPAILSQIVHVFYNLADTYFVGMTNDPNAVAAVSLCLPVYNMLTAISNLFGLGGTSVLARALGTRHREKCKTAFSAAVWGALIMGAVYALGLLIFCRPLLKLIGGSSGDIDYAATYAIITIVIGGIPTILAAALSHLVRATGDSGKASVGMTLGAVLNIALDPLFMFVLLPKGYEVVGAALATTLSNVVSLIYFAVYLLKNRERDIFSVHPKQLRGCKSIMLEIIRCGIPGFCMIGLAMLSNCVLNALISAMGSSKAVAGLGIVRKIDSLAYAVNQGITQGILPLVAYYYASMKHDKMMSAIKLATVITVSFSLVCSILSYLFAPELIGIFIGDEGTITYGTSFMRILCLAIPVYSITFVIIAVFQAVGSFWEPSILSVLHKGTLDIVLLLLINGLFGSQFILWASPITETAALLVGLLMLLHLVHRLRLRHAAPTP